MTRKVSWKEIARRLGDRMENHAWCDAHPLEEADPENCPFCDDRAIYLQYVERLRQDGERPDPDPGGPWETVTIEELSQRP